MNNIIIYEEDGKRKVTLAKFYENKYNNFWLDLITHEIIPNANIIEVFTADEITEKLELGSDFDLIMSCALRYALGRKTYITSLVSEYIIKHINAVEDGTALAMIKDLENCTDYGDECDKKVWIELLGKLKERMNDSSN